MYNDTMLKTYNTSTRDAFVSFRLKFLTFIVMSTFKCTTWKTHKERERERQRERKVLNKFGSYLHTISLINKTAMQMPQEKSITSPNCK